MGEMTSPEGDFHHNKEISGTSPEDETNTLREKLAMAGKELDNLSYDKGRDKKERMGVVEMFHLSEKYPEVVSFFEYIADSDIPEEERNYLLDLELQFLRRTISTEDEELLADRFVEYKRGLH